MNQETSAPVAHKATLTVPIAIIIAGLCIAGAILFTRGSTSAEESGTDISVRDITSEDHVYGSSDAPVVVVEYADFECPYCSLIHPTLKQIVDESGGKVAWVYRHLPLESIHTEARPAAKAAECVAEELGNDAFWSFSDALFSNQRELGSAYYAQVAASLGSNPETFAACFKSDRHDKRIDADTVEATRNGGQGTPFSIVIGKKGDPIPFSGALPYAQISAIVQAMISKQ